MYVETRDAGGIQGVASTAGGATSEVLSAALDHITDGVLLTGHDGVIVYVNTPLAELFGYDAAELVGETLDILLPEGNREEHHSHVKDYMASPGHRPMGREDLDIEGRRADGTRFSVDIQLDVLPGSSLVVATVRDMTDQRQAVVDNAIARIDLANASTRIAHLQASLDLVIQRLFALGTSIAAGEANEPILVDRLAGATRAIDEVIEVVQERRRGAGFVSQVS